MEKFTAIFEQQGDWWIAYVEELPGANSYQVAVERQQV